MKRVILFVLVLFFSNSESYPGYSEWLPTGNLPEGNVEAMLFNPVDNTLIIAVYGHGIYKSSDSGESWGESNQGLNNLLVKDLIITAGGDLYAATNGGGIFKSTDKGNFWQEINLGLDNTDVLCLAQNSLGHIFAGTWFGGHVYKSEDAGSNWASIGVNADVHAIICIGTDTILAGTQNLGIYKSVNSGETWLSAGMSGKDIYCFMALPNGNILNGNSQGLFLSGDRGGNWINAASGIGGARIGALAADPFGNLFAGSYDDNGIFISSDSAKNWSKFSSSFPETWVFSLVSDSSGNVFAGTKSGVFYVYDKPESAEDDIIVTGFDVMAYPNPFTEKVHFRINQQGASAINLQISDCFGNIIYESKSFTGRGSICWSPDNCPSGMYYYIIRSSAGIYHGSINYLR